MSTLTTTPAATPIRSAAMDMARSMLMALGTPLLARGLVTGDQLGAIVGGLLALASAVWSYVAAHPGGDPLASLKAMIARGGQGAAYDKALAALVRSMTPQLKAALDAQIKARAGILAGPVDGIANALIDQGAARAQAAAQAPLQHPQETTT
jgi:hypothetical protein